MRIGDIEIGLVQPPVLVAEMSGNHNQSLERALRIVEAVAETGVRMLKLQTYTADTITLDVEENEFVITDEASLWHGRSLYSLYQEASTPWEWHLPIIERAKQLGLGCFSSVFDETSVDFLEELGISAYKIASQECIHLPLIEKVAATNKPIVLSTGMASLTEISEAVCLIRDTSSSNIILMKCTSTYPASPEHSNILTIPSLKEIFQCPVGLSDHTPGIGAAVAAVAHGASMIEKHFTLSLGDGGVDSAFSMEPTEFGDLVRGTQQAWQSLGCVRFGPTESEIPSLTGRRSLYIAQDMRVGDIFNYENLRVIRPSHGLLPKYRNIILGRKIKKDADKGTPLNWELVG